MAMTAKYFGEERHGDAIYSIYLRKVRYVPPPGTESSLNVSHLTISVTLLEKGIS